MWSAVHLRTLALTAVLALASRPVGAQLLELQSGVRVRVRAPSLFGSRYDAVVGARRGDTLTLVREGASPVDVPLAAITAVEVFRGKSRGAGAVAGLVWGTAIGAAFGGAVALGDNTEFNKVDDRCTVNCEQYSDAELAMLMTVGSAALGAGIGALIGRARWESLAVRPTVSFGLPLGIATARGRSAVRLAMRLSM